MRNKIIASSVGFYMIFSITSVFADNAPRIKELYAELKQIGETIQQKQSEISQLTQKGLMDAGALEELKKQDEPKKK